MNTNTNYMRKSCIEFNTNKYKNNAYNNKYNSFKNKNHWREQEEKDKGKEDIILKKPIFTNSKLENNGNPEGNYIKIDLGGDNNIQKKSFNLVNIGEVQINNKINNSLLNINAKSKEIEQKIEESNINKNKEEIDNNNLPWRTGGINNKKEYYNKKKDNNYYYNSNKNHNHNNYYNYNNRNKYPLNQPKSKKGNKFD